MIDAAVVILASPILVPLAGLAMLAVVIEDRGSPIIRLARVGRFGDRMMVTKIRSMRQGKGAAITASNDDRITWTGKHLRSLRLDEIPQTLQVLTGDMALIGPRPESPNFVDVDDPQWQSVLQARPAIAGMTQVIAGTWEATELDVDDPETKYREVAVPAKLAIDRWYVENASPMLDLKIVAAVFQMLVTGADETVVHDIVHDEIPESAALKIPSVASAQ